MTIETSRLGNELTVALGGRLDSNTAPELETVLKNSCINVEKLVFEFSGLEYLSSAGLRILLASHKSMTASKGQMIIKNANQAILDIFNITGMIAIFNIE